MPSPVELDLLRRVSLAPPSAALCYDDLSEAEKRIAVHLVRRPVPLLHLENGHVLSITGAGLAVLSSAEAAAQQEAQKQADQAEAQAAKDAQAILDKQKAYRHDFKVAAFTVVLTLILEHLPEIYDLIKNALKTAWPLLK